MIMTIYQVRFLPKFDDRLQEVGYLCAGGHPSRARWKVNGHQGREVQVPHRGPGELSGAIVDGILNLKSCWIIDKE